MYVAVLLPGIFVFSAQVLVYAFVGHLYPPEIRGTALGMAAGVGRVGAIVGPFLGGALVTAGIAYPWGFYAFALAALLAVAALATVPAHMRLRDLGDQRGRARTLASCATAKAGHREATRAGLRALDPGDDLGAAGAVAGEEPSATPSVAQGHVAGPWAGRARGKARQPGVPRRRLRCGTLVGT